MKNIIIALLAFLVCCASCKKSDEAVNPTQWINRTAALYAHNQQKVKITEGLYGTVTMLTGNCMPIIDSNNTTCKEEPIQRNIYVYEYTNSFQADGDGTGSYRNIKTQLKAIIKGDNEGFFELKIEPGLYSIFIEEKGALYANGTDSANGINSVSVTPGKVTVANQRISYAAF